MVELPFQDRRQAGELLGAELALQLSTAEKPVVLALPRGGLPVGAAVAKALEAPMDVVLVRKIGVPWQPELAMGALAESSCLLDSQIIRELGIPEAEVQAAIDRQRRELKIREQLYRDSAGQPNLNGRTVILVDDGLATGATMLAAIRHIKSMQPRGVIAAVPVGTREACERVGRETVQCICLATPTPFIAVGEWYVDFGQVSDGEAQEILRQARNKHAPLQAGKK